jgi:hypothetical protein
MPCEETTLQNENVSCLAFSLQFADNPIFYTDHGKMPDAVLWEAFKNRDECAFVFIYKTYSTPRYDYGCRFFTDKEMVRDCLHVFFPQLKKNKKGFGETTPIKDYLFKAFKRRVVDFPKKNSCEHSLGQLFDYNLNPSE